MAAPGGAADLPAAAPAPLDEAWVAALDARLNDVQQGAPNSAALIALLRAHYATRPQQIDLQSLAVGEFAAPQEAIAIIAPLAAAVDFGVPQPAAAAAAPAEGAQAAGQAAQAAALAQLQGQLQFGPTFFPWALLDGDTGVEMRYRHLLRFRAVSDGQMAAARAQLAQRQANRVEDFAHCNQLLVQLPEALNNSRRAEQALLDSITAGESEDMAGVGAIKVEQRRIEHEIAVQQTRLNVLNATPEPTLAAELEPLWRNRRLQIALPLGWGVQRWNGQLFHLSRVTPPPQQLGGGFVDDE